MVGFGVQEQVVCLTLAIGAGIAVSFGWYGLATTLALSSLGFIISEAASYIGHQFDPLILSAETRDAERRARKDRPG